MKSKIESIKRYWHDNIESWILKNRTYSLFRAGLIGIVLAISMYWGFFLLENTVLRGSLTILALGLPTFFILWLFRTEDVQRQIDKTEENTNNSTFFECARMLIESTQQEEEVKEKSLSAKIALEQLAYLRKETGFDEKKIDTLTKRCDLEKKNLNNALLSGLDLSGAKLNNAQLISTDLSNTDLFCSDLINTYLSYAKLNNTNLKYAKLNNANLKSTNLSDVVYNDETEWQGATYDDKTNFGDTKFKDKRARDDAGMIYQPDE